MYVRGGGGPNQPPPRQHSFPGCRAIEGRRADSSIPALANHAAPRLGAAEGGSLQPTCVALPPIFALRVCRHDLGGAVQCLRARHMHERMTVKHKGPAPARPPPPRVLLYALRRVLAHFRSLY